MARRVLMADVSGGRVRCEYGLGQQRDNGARDSMKKRRKIGKSGEPWCISR